MAVTVSGTARTTVRRRVARATRRNSYRAVGLYAQGLGLRGTMTYPEVRGLRALLEFQLARPAFRPDPRTLVEQVRARHGGGQVRGEWVERPGIRTRGDAVVLYVHGGAFVSGSPRSHRGLTSELSRRLHRSVFSVDYRLAPEYRFPAAADDVLRAYAWLLSSGVPAERVVVAGDSAGGHLALGLTPRAVRAQLPAPAAVVAFSPLVDPSMALSGARQREAETRDRLIGAAAGRAAIRLYHRGVGTEHPELLLTNDDLSVLPPVLIQASADEILAADAEHYMTALHAAGGVGDLRLWPRQVHVFQVAFRISRAAAEALDDVQEFVQKIVPV
jgi:acetyl esterase/lipase